MEEELQLLVNELLSFWGTGAISDYGNKMVYRLSK